VFHSTGVPGVCDYSFSLSSLARCILFTYPRRTMAMMTASSKKLCVSRRQWQYSTHCSLRNSIMLLQYGNPPSLCQKFQCTNNTVDNSYSVPKPNRMFVLCLACLVIFVRCSYTGEGAPVLQSRARE